MRSFYTVAAGIFYILAWKWIINWMLYVICEKCLQGLIIYSHTMKVKTIIVNIPNSLINTQILKAKI